MVETAIRKILGNGAKRITIPGLGTFIVRGPGEIVFTDMLTANDGILAGELMAEYGITEEEALGRISATASSLQKSLAENNRAAIGGFGLLTRTIDGTYNFMPVSLADTSNNHIPEQSVPEANPTEPAQDDIAEQTAEVAGQHPAQEDTVPVTVDGHITGPETHEANTYDAPVENTCEAPETTETITEEFPATKKNTETDDIVPELSDKSNLRNLLYGEESSYEDIVILDIAENKKDTDSLSETKENIADDTSKEDEEKARTAHCETDEKHEKSHHNSVLMSAIIGQDDEEETQGYVPQINIRHPRKTKKRLDLVLIIALIAAAIAIGVIAYGLLAERDINGGLEIELPAEPAE